MAWNSRRQRSINTADVHIGGPTGLTMGMVATPCRITYRKRWLVPMLWAASLAGRSSIGQRVSRASVVMLSQFEHYSPSIRRLRYGPELFAIAGGRHPRGPNLIQSIINVASQLHEIDGVVDVRDGYLAQAASSGQSTTVC